MKKREYIIIRDERGWYEYTRPLYDFGENGEEIYLWPPIVNDYAHWKENWDEILDNSDPDHPFRLRDLIHICKKEEIHPSFLEEITRQLTPKINRLVGVELQNLDVMMGVDTARPKKKNGWSYIYMDITAYANGTAFWLKWKSLIPGQEYIPMSQPVNSDNVQFEICTTMEIEGYNHPDYKPNAWIGHLKDVILPRLALKMKYTFDIDAKEVMWPDVHFNMIFNRTVTEDMVEEVGRRIGSFLNRWTEKDGLDQQEAVHYMSEVKKSDTSSIEFDVDYGSVSEIVLLKTLETMQKNFSPDLIKVILS